MIIEYPLLSVHEKYYGRCINFKGNKKTNHAKKIKKKKKKFDNYYLYK